MLDTSVLEDLRKQKNISMEKLSYKLGYKSPSAYGMKLSGARNFTIRDLVLLANLYNVSSDYLLSR